MNGDSGFVALYHCQGDVGVQCRQRFVNGLNLYAVHSLFGVIQAVLHCEVKDVLGNVNFAGVNVDNFLRVYISLCKRRNRGVLLSH